MHFNSRLSRKVEIKKAIEAKVIATEIWPGAPLDEEALACEFKVSRTPIREICSSLAAEMTVVHRPNSGMFAAPVTSATVNRLIEAERVVFLRVPEIFSSANITTNSMLCKILLDDHVVKSNTTLDVDQCAKLLSIIQIISDAMDNRFLAQLFLSTSKERLKVLMLAQKIAHCKAEYQYHVVKAMEEYLQLLRTVIQNEISSNYPDIFESLLNKFKIPHQIIIPFLTDSDDCFATSVAMKTLQRSLLKEVS